MSRLRVIFLLAIGVFLAAHPMLAANFAVGTCKPSLPSYTTISAAVSSVPPGSTVQVCPGTYPEQVTIAQPLTLKGITSGNAGQAVVTVPGSELAVVTSAYGYSIAAQVAVTATAGPVNITDITVDGTGNDLTYPTWNVGIFYADGSSGAVNGITARNLAGAGVGAWAENSGATNQSLSITNSSFHDIDDSAVITLGSTLLVTAKGNTMGAGYYQVQWFSGGSPTGNVINGEFVGISVSGPVTVSSNTVANMTFGILASGGITASTNKISNVATGIYDQGGGNTYKTNSITKAGVGIEFNCQSPTVLHNTINDATTGINDVPSSFSGVNTFYNVVTLRTDGCPARPESPRAHSGPVPALAR